MPRSAGFLYRGNSCPQSQAGQSQHSSDPSGRTARPAAAAAGAGPQVPFRVHVRAAQTIAVLADWLPGPLYLQALFSWFWFRSSILFSSLACSVQWQEPGHSERERTLAACLPAQLWLQPLPRAETAFAEKRRVIGFLQSWQFPPLSGVAPPRGRGYAA
jgi:hypothetical protein